jgi:hypothetical protein
MGSSPEHVEHRASEPQDPLPASLVRRQAAARSALSPRWPERPIGLSSHRLVGLLDLRDEILERDASTADCIGYMARLLIQTTLPHRNPGSVPVWTRTNGNFTLQITPGYSLASATRPSRLLGIPFGVYPRLVFTYLTSEAVRTRSAEIYLGRSFSEFTRRLGLDVRGGERGTIGRLKDQLARLTRATIDWSYVDGNTELSEGIRPIEGSYTFWDTARPSSEAIWPSSVSLNARLFDELIRAPVPIDMRVVQQLSHLRSPMAMDIYQWLTYRQYRLLESGRPRVVIPWHSLAGQFGAGYRRIRAFRSSFVEALRVVLVVYPGGSATPTDPGLLLTPGRPHVPHAASRSTQALPRLGSARTD